MDGKLLKIIIKYYQIAESGDVILQTRVYKDPEKAKRFLEELPFRGIKKCLINTITEKIF